MACKDKEAPPPPPACEVGDNINDIDYVVTEEKPTPKPLEDIPFKLKMPSTVYVEVLVLISQDLTDTIAKIYNKGKWSAKNFTRNAAAFSVNDEVMLYVRRFLSAVNIKFQGQFKTPKIKFFLREVFKILTIFKISAEP